jgi:hypothetical protein
MSGTSNACSLVVDLIAAISPWLQNSEGKNALPSVILQLPIAICPMA